MQVAVGLCRTLEYFPHELIFEAWITMYWDTNLKSEGTTLKTDRPLEDSFVCDVRLAIFAWKTR